MAKSRFNFILSLICVVVLALAIDGVDGGKKSKDEFRKRKLQAKINVHGQQAVNRSARFAASPPAHGNCADTLCIPYPTLESPIFEDVVRQTVIRRTKSTAPPRRQDGPFSGSQVHTYGAGSVVTMILFIVLFPLHHV
jgi:hypothetical protein